MKTVTQTAYYAFALVLCGMAAPGCSSTNTGRIGGTCSRLNGTWAGHEVDPYGDDRGPVSFQINNDQIQGTIEDYGYDAESYTLTVSCNDNVTPNQISGTVTASNQPGAVGQPFYGIYEMDPSAGSGRLSGFKPGSATFPTTFSTGSGQRLFVFGAATGGSSGVGGNSNTGGSKPVGGGGSSSIPGTQASGGSAATGGLSSLGSTQATGGLPNVGGAPGAGGATSAGGSVATGGVTSASGTALTGGATATGGAPNVGGATATGGSFSAGGAPAVQTVINSFDTPSLEGVFSPDTYVPTDCGVNLGAKNDAGTSLQVGWSGSVDVDADATTKGSMKITATFTGWDQRVDVVMEGPSDANRLPLDLTNKTVRVSVEFASNTSPNPSYPFGAVLFIKTGDDWVWGQSDWVNIQSTGAWTTVSLDMAAPNGVPSGSVYDPSSPMQLGIEISTGGAAETSYCAQDYAAPFGDPVTSVIYIDRITVEDNPT